MKSVWGQGWGIGDMVLGSRGSRSVLWQGRLWEQWKWEEQERLEDWARENSPGTAEAEGSRAGE